MLLQVGLVRLQLRYLTLHFLVLRLDVACASNRWRVFSNIQRVPAATTHRQLQSGPSDGPDEHSARW